MGNETKVFLPLSPIFNEEDCLWLTIGIGNDTLVEQVFKANYPGCKLYGIEASPSVYDKYPEIGTVIPFGVGMERGSFPVVLLKNNEWFEQNITVVPLKELLEEFVGKKIIHYMTIDLEGFEYPILSEVLTGRQLDREGIVFCQIDAELHGHKRLAVESEQPIQQYLHQFNVENSNYLPIHRVNYHMHQKLTFINIKHPECQKAFDLSAYFV